MDLRQEVRDLLQKIGPGRMVHTAYDTAWIARLVDLGEPIGRLASEWLREHQLEDGSWGAAQPYYHHDRTICTLAAINALARQGRVHDRERLRRAEAALAVATKGLACDPAGETIGFELIVPTLITEAKALGGLHYQEAEILKQLAPQRAAKLAALPEGMVNRFVTVAFSSEMAGPDGRHLLDAKHLQEANGSVGHSPSATAYYALYVSRRDPAALKYLHEVATKGKAPNVAPFDVFEPAWVLWNLLLTDALDEDLLTLCQPHLDFLEQAWVPGAGISHAAGYTPKDGDDTSLVYEVLTRFGRQVDLEAVQSYEHVYYYRCFDLESNPSISANIHVLGALRHAGLDKEHPSVQKVLRFLEETWSDGTFWHDKWHASPYYATTQAIIAAAGYVDELVLQTIDWVLAMQNEDGSWGYYAVPTAEETAYCLQALHVWKRQGYSIPREVLKRGTEWLEKHAVSPYPPLWIGKCLYCPELVVRSAVLSALMLMTSD